MEESNALVPVVGLAAAADIVPAKTRENVISNDSSL